VHGLPAEANLEPGHPARGQLRSLQDRACQVCSLRRAVQRHQEQLAGHPDLHAIGEQVHSRLWGRRGGGDRRRRVQPQERHLGGIGSGYLLPDRPRL